jgi:hypothetical protein
VLLLSLAKPCAYITPAEVIKTAIAANLIENGEIGMEALDARSKMSHTYGFRKFEKIISDIAKDYYPEINKMNLKMLKFAEEV